LWSALRHAGIFRKHPAKVLLKKGQKKGKEEFSFPTEGE
jgi:hypothetical protein